MTEADILTIENFAVSINFRPKIVTTNTKVDRREIGKERKALKAAQLDRAIENELLERLKQVSENEIYNYPEQQYKKILSRVAEKFEGNFISIVNVEYFKQFLIHREIYSIILKTRMKKLRMRTKERKKWKPRSTEKMRNTMLNTSR
jgi:Mak16 protein C-terminal region